jgi:tetratricopeptide (TPR) repeat protein
MNAHMDRIGDLLLLAVGPFIVVWGTVQLWATSRARLADKELAQRRPAHALRAIAPLRRLPGRNFQTAVLVVEFQANTQTGNHDDAAKALGKLSALKAAGLSIWSEVNLATCELVTAGRYQEALTVDRSWPADDLDLAKTVDPAMFGVTLINRAEALHNLARNDEAHALLDTATPLVADYPLGKHGLQCLRAWILIHQGDLERAREALSSVERAALAPFFTAEVDFTWAALERDTGDYSQALSHAEQGLSLAERPSSVRNGHFMIATIAALSGDSARALKEFEKALAHPYKGQARYGLLRFAAFLSARGDTVRATEVMHLSTKLDPESALETPGVPPVQP